MSAGAARGRGPSGAPGDNAHFVYARAYRYVEVPVGAIRESLGK